MAAAEPGDRAAVNAWAGGPAGSTTRRPRRCTTLPRATRSTATYTRAGSTVAPSASGATCATWSTAFCSTTTTVPGRQSRASQRPACGVCWAWPAAPSPPAVPRQRRRSPVPRPAALPRRVRARAAPQVTTDDYAHTSLLSGGRCDRTHRARADDGDLRHGGVRLHAPALPPKGTVRADPGTHVARLLIRAW